MDEFGQLDFGRVGGGMSKKKVATAIVKALSLEARDRCNTTFTTDQIREIVNARGIKTDDLNQVIGNLNNEGMILKKGNNVWQVQILH